MQRDLWTLDANAQAEAGEVYRVACAHIFDITLSGPDADFYNYLESYRLDSVVIGSCRGVAQRFERTFRHIQADGSDGVQLILQCQGSWQANYDGRTVDDEAGSIRVVDMARPFDTHETAFRTINVMMPRSLLAEAGKLDLHGMVVAETSASGLLLASYLRSLWDSLARITDKEASAAAKALVDLAAGAITAHANQRSERHISRILLTAARAYIDRHFHDLTLTPKTLGAAIGVSRTQLYELFVPLGGVSTFIQTRRLDGAFDAIVADEAAVHSLASIGYAHGFRSDAHFSRLFRARFGIPPGELRRRRARARKVDLSIIERPGDVWTWLRDL